MIDVNQVNIFSQHSSFIPLVRELRYRKLLRGEHITTPLKSDLYLLCLVQNGRAKFEYKDISLEVERNQFVLVQPYISCAVTAMEAQTEIVGVPFGLTSADSLDVPYNLPNNTSILGQQLSKRKGLESALQGALERLPGRYVFELVDCVSRLSKEQSLGGTLSASLQRAIMLELLIYMQRSILEENAYNQKVRTGKIHELIKLSRDYMVQNFAKDISIADVARTIFLSPGYFTRIFREEIGMSPLSYLLQLRIARACVLLQDQQIKVNSIANQVGFSSPQRFNTMFRKQMYMTPLEYRRRYQDLVEDEADFIDIDELLLEYAGDSMAE